MHEAAFYHALNLELQSNYVRLRKALALWGSWEKAWRRSKARKTDPGQAWRALQETGIGLIMQGEAGFPPLLAEMPHPPFGIYYKGNLSAVLDAKAVAAIVGTRKASTAGKAAAQEFGGELARAGVAVVSGLAYGIDAAAHAGSLKGGGAVAAVVANGLDSVYPATHYSLAEGIAQSGGVLISEYPPGSPPLPYRFLERNRLISGLAHAVLIIEAPERSGVIATARFAGEQGRDLYVMPGSVSHPNYKGSHLLIREGATLVTTAAELLLDMGLKPPERPPAAVEITPQETRVLDALRAAARALTIDEIIEAATLTSSIVSQTLTLLTLKNLVREENGRFEPCN